MQAALIHLVTGVKAIVAGSKYVVASTEAAKAALQNVQNAADLQIHPVPHTYPTPGMFD
jgi:hypothetical protein